MQCVLLGSWDGAKKAVGPFDDEDSAREFCNSLAMLEVDWEVIPLSAP